MKGAYLGEKVVKENEYLSAMMYNWKSRRYKEEEEDGENREN